VKLKQHVPEILPIFGKRFNLWYPGIPKQCKNCYEFEHIASQCKNQRLEWLDYVAKVHGTGYFRDELFGTWIDTLKKYHPKFKTDDLRSVIDAGKTDRRPDDLRYQLGNNPDSDARTRIGYNRGDVQGGRYHRGRRGNSQYHDHWQSDNSNWNEGAGNYYRPRGRGYRGRGHRGQRQRYRPRGNYYN